MRKKNGFTLVELLAVIVILAIILAIAVPSITDIIKNSKFNAFNNNSKMLERAARNYLGSTGTSIASGATSFITYNTLKTGGYLTAIVDPTSNNECTHSGVYVTNTSGTYTYKPALACDNYMNVDSYNLDTNADFSNSTTGWSVAYSNLTAASNILSITGSGANNTTRAYQSITLVQNHIYYVRAVVKVTNSSASSVALGYMNNGALVAVATQNTPTQNQTYTLSGTFTAPAPTGTTGLPYIWATYADAATATNKVTQVDGTRVVYTLDLTAIYGSGSEPTAAAMNTIMTNMGR